MNGSPNYNRSTVRESILEQYNDVGFSGLSFTELKAGLPEDFDDITAKKEIGRLLAEHEIEYIDFRCFRVFSAFNDALNAYSQSLDEHDLLIVKMALTGISLSQLSVVFSVSTELLLQSIYNSINLIKAAYTTATGKKFFDEDYYGYLCSEYDIPLDFMTDYLNLRIESASYLRLIYPHFSDHIKPLEMGISDVKLALGVRLKIKSYRDRIRLAIDGNHITADRGCVVDYILEKYCTEATDFRDLGGLYTSILEINKIKPEKTLAWNSEYAVELKKTLKKSLYVLWTNNDIFRYYSIPSYDFTELFDVLSLENFHNTEISVKLLFNRCASLMEKYDIQNVDELFELLRKLGVEKKYPGLDMSCHPMLRFGTPDIKKEIRALIHSTVPISQKKLLSLIESRYGYEKSHITVSLLADYVDCYSNGIYNVIRVPVTPEQEEVMQKFLTADYYTLSGLEDVCVSLFPDADPNTDYYSAACKLGFHIDNEFLLRTASSLKDYLTGLLTSGSDLDLTQLRRIFGFSPVFNEVISDLESSQRIFRISDSICTTIEGLSERGITQDSIKAFVSDVLTAVSEDSFFTLYSLRKAGLQLRFDNLEFGDRLMTSVLSGSGLFAVKHVYGTYIFCRTAPNDDFDETDFIRCMLKGETSVDVDDFMEKCRCEYGVDIPSVKEVTGAIECSAFYYVDVMNRIYLNRNTYYRTMSDNS